MFSKGRFTGSIKSKTFGQISGCGDELVATREENHQLAEYDRWNAHHTEAPADTQSGRGSPG
jgi:hypothetical protein